jgi:two-component system OmpR family sensor kinase
MNLKSIRWKLSLTYAGIALVTALAMGAVLLLTLRSYYGGQEQAYLEKNARAVNLAIAPLLTSEKPPEELGMHIKLLSFLSQIRVRLLDAQGRLVVDSGTPGQDSPIMVSAIARPASFDPQAEDGAGNAIELAKPSSIDPGTGEAADSSIQQVRPALPTLPNQVFIEKQDGGQFLFSLGLRQSDPAEADKQVAALPSAGPTDKLRFFYRQTDKPLDTIGGLVGMESGSSVSSSRTLVAVIPASGTMYGFDLQAGPAISEARSSQVALQKIVSEDGKVLGTLIVSDGPAIGSEIVSGVARGGIVAALAAVVIAAALGWLVSRHMSAPLTELTGSARRMSTGDLGARARVTSTDEFGGLATAFNDMAGRVQEIVASLRGFASDAAHELQTPLTALNTNLELAARENPDSRYVAQAREQFLRLELLAANLLDLSRIENAEPGATFEPVDLAGLLRKVGERCASEAEQARQMFYLEVPDGPIVVSGRADQLQRAIANLIENAIKFTPAGGLIEAGVAEADGRVSLWVEDNGIGIPPEDHANLFQRFHRGHNASELPGSGLGLAIVQAIAEKHCGRVRYESLTKGSKFWLELPAEKTERKQ